jgi:hypothetical protein
LFLPVDDDGVLVALALGEDDALILGLDDGLDEDVPEAEEEVADAGACVGVWLVLQLGCAAGVLLSGTVGLGLLLGLPLADGVPVVVGLGLGLLLADGVLVVVEVGLGLLLAPALELAVLLWLPLDEVAGAVVVRVAVLGELVVLCVADGCAEDDAQAVVPAAAFGPEPLAEPPLGECAGGVPALFVLGGPTRAVLMAS